MNLPKKRQKGRKKERVELTTDGYKPWAKGYASVRRLVESGSRFTRSCYNCEYYYQAPEDDCEMCQNPNVLRFDMVTTENSVYCNRWEMCSRRTDAKSLFSKGSHK